MTYLFDNNQTVTNDVTVHVRHANANVSLTNPFPVTLGSENITITGDVNIGTTVSVNSTSEDPVHVHVSEVGNSGILTTPNMPISIQDVNGNINSNTYPVYTSTYISSGNVNANVTGGNVNANVSGSVIKIGDANGNVNSSTYPLFVAANVTGGNVNANVTGGNVNATVTGSVTVTSLPEVEIKNDTGNPIPVSWVYGNSVSAIPWEVQVARGKISGVSALNISGYNDDVGTSFVPLWHGNTTYVFPPSASTMRIWSNSASDTNVQVTVSGLDASYNLLSETITLTNGSTGVLTTGSYLRINTLSIVNDPTNVGVIFCGNSAKTQYYCAIEAGAGRSQQTVYTVPNGYTFYLTQSNWYTNNTGNNTGLYRSWTQAQGGAVNIILVFPFPVNYNSRKVAPRPYPGKTDIQWQVSSKSGSCAVGGQIEGFLIANSVT